PAASLPSPLQQPLRAGSPGRSRVRPSPANSRSFQIRLKAALGPPSGGFCKSFCRSHGRSALMAGSSSPDSLVSEASRSSS
uniref:Uncharacterized protein n=1 Tax=Gopherus agassizii TaxID=38772 RepID=A0A452HP34_9SAUR